MCCLFRYFIVGFTWFCIPKNKKKCTTLLLLLYVIDLIHLFTPVFRLIAEKVCKRALLIF